uniref:Carn_acyltransf domain-containing protein n=1 Tax=Strongyloides venezuelensis TaxID=75913 RepID=A0A0K0G2W6_STRVS
MFINGKQKKCDDGNTKTNESCQSQLAFNKEQPKPIGEGMLCTSHYKKIFCGCEFPGIEKDYIINNGPQNYLDAICLIYLCDRDDIGDDHDSTDKFLLENLTGNGINRWVDKSVNYVITKSGCFGGTTEHSIADGSEFDHFMENYIKADKYNIEYPKVIKNMYENQIKEDQKKFLLTYEAASVRFYQNSRTETLKSVTNDSCNFVRGMIDENIKKEKNI